MSNNKKYFWTTPTHLKKISFFFHWTFTKENIIYKYTYIQDIHFKKKNKKIDQDVPVYEAVEDDEGGEREDCDHNGGSCWHLKYLNIDLLWQIEISKISFKPLLW